MPARRTEDRLSRREALRVLTGAGGVALLAACGASGATQAPGGATAPTAPTATAAVQRGIAPSAAATAVKSAATSPSARVAGTAAAPPGATPLAVAGPITIYPTGAKLPTEQVSFHWVVRGLGPKGTFYQQFFPVYQQAHPNIKVQYDGLPPTELTKVIPLGVQNGNAPDCFEAPAGITAGQMVREGWVRPLDDLIPDFAAWKSRLPTGMLAEGITTFNGKTYGCPYLSNKQYDTLLLYNIPYVQGADYDPTTTPLTWDTYRTAAKKVTERGKGQYYGVIIEGKDPGRWSAIVSNLAEMAGAPGGTLNWRTGEYNYTSDQFLAAIDLLLALKADGSVFPGSLQLDNAQARSRMTQGVAGMILQGAFNIPTWPDENRDFNFGVASQPLPNSGTPAPMSSSPGPYLPLFVYAKSPHPEIAGNLFAYLTSAAGQTAFAAISKGFPLPITPPSREQASAAGLDARMLKAYTLFAEQLRVGPDPRVRNPDVGQVDLEQKAITPDFGSTIQGLYTGQLKDPKAAMQDLQDRAEAELQRAIKAAQAKGAKGAKVSRDDWKFPNWDPTRDYTQADYDALTR